MYTLLWDGLVCTYFKILFKCSWYFPYSQKLFWARLNNTCGKEERTKSNAVDLNSKSWQQNKSKSTFTPTVSAQFSPLSPEVGNQQKNSLPVLVKHGELN
jgi:hypothetical protein